MSPTRCTQEVNPIILVEPATRRLILSINTSDYSMWYIYEMKLIKTVLINMNQLRMTAINLYKLKLSLHELKTKQSDFNRIENVINFCSHQRTKLNLKLDHKQWWSSLISIKEYKLWSMWLICFELCMRFEREKVRNDKNESDDWWNDNGKCFCVVCFARYTQNHYYIRVCLGLGLSSPAFV